MCSIYNPSCAEHELPTRVDLTHLCPPIVDQGDLGSCTANALAAAWGFLLMKEGADTFQPASRLFIYFQERLAEGTVNQDAGATLYDGIRAMQRVGCCGEKFWPYIPALFNIPPVPEAQQEAAKHKITDAGKLSTLHQMKDCLAKGLPFVFGFQVFENFESEEMAKNGMLGMPSKGEQYMGGHAVMAVGYNDESKTFLIRNSWGEQWGKNGYFEMPFEYIGNPNLADEFWAVIK